MRSCDWGKLGGVEVMDRGLLMPVWTSRLVGEAVGFVVG